MFGKTNIPCPKLGRTPSFDQPDLHVSDVHIHSCSAYAWRMLGLVQGLSGLGLWVARSLVSGTYWVLGP